MDWILGHLQIVVAVAAAIAYWFNQQKAAARGDEDERTPETRPFEQVRADVTDDEQTRRVQEEIRRKIAERRGAAPPAASMPAPAPRPVAPPFMAPRPVAREMTGGLRERLEAKLAEARARTEAAARERQAQLESEARKLEDERLATQRRAAELLKAVQATPASVAPAYEAKFGDTGQWLNELRDRKSLRRTMVLREVLGPPVALR